MSETNLPKGWEGANEVKSNWFKFENVGDNVKGTLTARRKQESDSPNFPDQYVYELKDEEGNMWNVGISVKKSGTVQRLNSCKIGQIVGILFSEEIPATTKGFANTKVLKVVEFGMDKDYEAFEADSKDDIPFVD
jgi:hypothetical protein